MNGDTPFDRLVGNALSEPISPEIADRLDGRVAPILARESLAQSGPRRLTMPHRKVRTGLLLAAALLIVVACTVATDSYGNSETSTQVDDEMAAARAVTPIPPGATWPTMHAPGVIEDPDQPGATISVLYTYPQGNFSVDYTAACMWEGYWLDGYDRADAAQMSNALAGLEESRTWKAFSLGSGSGMSNAHKEVVDAAERGDPAPVRTFMSEFGCTLFVSPGASPSTRN